MAIFGIGARYDDQWVNKSFIEHKMACIGHERADTPEIYAEFRTLKVGDIIYMKALGPSSDRMCIMGVGIVTNNFIKEIITDEDTDDEIHWGHGVKVNWVFDGEEYYASKGLDKDKHWHRRVGTFYEEHSRKIQKLIIRMLLDPDRYADDD